MFITNGNLVGIKRIARSVYMVGVVMMLIGVSPVKADEFIIDIREDCPGLFELPEWCRAFDEAEINNRVLRDYLKEKIIPYFENAEGKGENRLYVKFTGEKDANGEKVNITAMSKCRTCSGMEQSFNDPDENNKTYVTIISGVVVFLVNERGVSKLITPLGKQYIPNPDYWSPLITIHDPVGCWQVHVTDSNIKLDWFQRGEGDVFKNWKDR